MVICFDGLVILNIVAEGEFGKQVKNYCWVYMNGLMTVSELLRTYPSPTNPNSNPNLLSIDCCWIKGGVGTQFLRY